MSTYRTLTFFAAAATIVGALVGITAILLEDPRVQVHVFWGLMFAMSNGLLWFRGGRCYGCGGRCDDRQIPTGKINDRF